MSALEELMKKAWQARTANFPPSIYFAYPNNTTPITLTGKSCDLDCAHCGGHYLEHMVSMEDAEETLKKKGSHSCLISGGCDHKGTVPLSEQIDFLEKLKKDNYRLNSHIGLASQEEIEGISKHVDVVSFDFVSDEETIREVYNLPHTAEDYINCYKALKEKTTVFPHICIGLKGGEIKGEYKTLEILEELGADALVFIVFIPTKGTAYANRQAPDLEEVGKVLATARIKFPHIPIFLGCMRPKGSYRGQLDLLAVKCGVNKIVIPAPSAVNYVEQLGWEIIRGQECCAL